MTNEFIPKQELEVYEKQLGTAEKFGLSLEVKSDEDYQSALIEGKSIKEQLEIIVKRKEEITKPLNVTLKSVRALFAPLENSLESTLKIIKTKMVGYTDEKERKAEVASKKIDARVEKGTLSQAQANVKKFVNEIPKTVATSAGSATTKKVKKYYIVDKSLVPLDFLEVDMVRVKASYKSGFPVPGIEERLESELSIS